MLLQIDFGPIIESRNSNLRESTVGMLLAQKIWAPFFFAIRKGISAHV